MTDKRADQIAREREYEAQRHEHAPHQHASHQPAEPKPLAGHELGLIADVARGVWASRNEAVAFDRLGRDWRFIILSEPFPGLYIRCGEIGLGLTYMALDAEGGDGAVRQAVADLAKAVVPVPGPPVPDPPDHRHG